MTHTKKRKSMKRRITTIIFYLVVLVLILFGLFIAVTDTAMGFKLGLRFASPILSSYGVSFEGPIEGNLYNFTLPKVTLKQGGKIITLKQVSLDWDPMKLFKSHLMVNSAKAELIWPIQSAKRKATPLSQKSIDAASQAIPIPNLNFELNINQLHLTVLDSNDKTLMKASGKVTLHQGKLMLDHINLKGSGFQTKLNGFVDQYTHSQFQFIGSWKYKHNNLSLAGLLSAQGDFNNYQILFKANQLENDAPMKLLIKAHGNLKQIQSTDFSFKRSDGEANGQFKVQFIPLKWNAEVAGDQIDWHEQIQANDPLLSFNFNASGNSHNQKLAGHLSSGSNKANLKLSRNATGDIALQTLNIDSETGRWTVDPTTFYEDPDGFHIPKTCIQQKQNKVCLSARLAGQKLTGELGVNLTDLSPFADFTPDVSNISGKVMGKMSLSGTKTKPVFKGEIALDKATLSVPTFGLDLKNTHLAFTSKGGSSVGIDGATTSGSGTLKVGGVISWKKNRAVIALGLNGKNVTVVNLPEATVSVSPTLTYVENKKIILLEGAIQVDQADINANQFKESAGLDTKDIVYVDADNKAIHQRRTLPFATNLQVLAKNTIKFKGYGINSSIGGQLSINSLPEQSTTATGRLDIQKGTYQAYGKIFNVTKGSLIFNNSPIDDPALDVYAQYELNTVSTDISANEIKVGVHVTGSLNHIKISLYSEPSMTQENILSYILTGGPIEKAGPGAQVALSQAALSIATGGDDESVLDQIKDKLQLNQLSVGSLNSGPSSNLAASRASEGDQNNTAVFIGKSITNRFSVSYGVGLFNDQQIFKTLYRLTKNWSLQTDNSTLGSGADIIYTFER